MDNELLYVVLRGLLLYVSPFLAGGHRVVAAGSPQQTGACQYHSLQLATLASYLALMRRVGGGWGAARGELVASQTGRFCYPTVFLNLSKISHVSFLTYVERTTAHNSRRLILNKPAGEPATAHDFWTLSNSVHRELS